MDNLKQKTIAKKAITFTRFYKILERLNRKRVIILMYHGFFDESNPEGIEQYSGRWCSIQNFKEQMHHLKQEYNVIPLEHLIDSYIRDKPVPDKTVVITMDDGYRSDYSLAYPVLRQEQIPASIFVCTSFVDSKEYMWSDRIEYAIWKSENDALRIKVSNESRYYKTASESDKVKSVADIKAKLGLLSHDERVSVIKEIEDRTRKRISVETTTTLQLPVQWSEIRDMVSDGIVSIGSHSIRHPNLTTCTDQQLEEEIVESRRIIESRVGGECRLFCYPGGKYNDRVKQSVIRAGYKCALAVKGGYETQDNADKFELARIGIHRTLSIHDFICRLCFSRKPNVPTSVRNMVERGVRYGK